MALAVEKPKIEDSYDKCSKKHSRNASLFCGGEGLRVGQRRTYITLRFGGDKSRSVVFYKQHRDVLLVQKVNQYNIGHQPSRNKVQIGPNLQWLTPWNGVSQVCVCDTTGRYSSKD